MLAAALAVRLGSHGPVLHREPVVGEHGRAVSVLSFRVMVDGGATRAHEQLRSVIGAAGERPFAGPGRLLRTTRIQALPRLLNVAAGQLPLR
jgi:lipopolysaccharide/colanic/teichoic acid biosynthesis glycosyltransferase